MNLFIINATTKPVYHHCTLSGWMELSGLLDNRFGNFGGGQQPTA